MWADWQFFIVALTRLRRAAEIALGVTSVKDEVRRAVDAFDGALPVRRMRDIAEHINDYALDRGRLPDVGRRALESGAFNDTTLRWLVSTDELNADTALACAEELHSVVLRVATTG